MGVQVLGEDGQQGLKPFSPDHTLLIPTTSPKQSQRKPKKGRMASAAMAIANYKRRTSQLQQEKSQDQPSNFSHQSTQGSIFSRPSPDFTVSANPNGTKKWSCDGGGVTINTKWFPSTTSRATRRLSFSGQEFLSAWGQD